MFNKLAKTYLGSTIPVINVYGAITPKTTQQIVKRLQKISTKQAVALAVVINSPGGLPVQSQIISQKLQNFSKKHSLKLYTFARDVAASGGYMILSSGEHVVADRSSIVGSIGVIIQRYKLKGLLDHFDVDHKQFATHNKLLQSVLSPFEDISPTGKQYIKQLCDQSHVKFIEDVKRKRGNKLKNDPSIFTGEVWTGDQALQLGLVDEVGSLINILSARHPGAKLQVQPENRSILQKLLNL